jgi:hypothetical protein
MAGVSNYVAYQQTQQISALAQHLQTTKELWYGAVGWYKLDPIQLDAAIADVHGKNLAFGIKNVDAFQGWLSEPRTFQGHSVHDAAWQYCREVSLWSSDPEYGQVPWQLSKGQWLPEAPGTGAKPTEYWTATPHQYRGTSSTSTFGRTAALILAIIAVIAILVFLTRKGIRVHHSYTGGPPIITQQTGGFGIPSCLKCEVELMQQWIDHGRVVNQINPMVHMKYATGPYDPYVRYIPYWFLDTTPPQSSDYGYV